jgi:hypothetical protein
LFLRTTFASAATAYLETLDLGTEECDEPVKRSNSPEARTEPTIDGFDSEAVGALAEEWETAEDAEAAVASESASDALGKATPIPATPEQAKKPNIPSMFKPKDGADTDKRLQ